MKNSLDRYIYAIRTLKEQYLCVRAVDVAHYLGLSKASVSIAVRQMREMGLVEAEADGNLLFTAEGKKRADLLTCRITFQTENVHFPDDQVNRIQVSNNTQRSHMSMQIPTR